MYTPLLMIQDSNTVAGFGWNTIVEFTGGDWILIGLVIFAMLALVMLFAKVRSGAAIVIGVGFSYLLSTFVPDFAFIFWIAIIAGMFMLVQGMRKQSTGQ